MRLLLASLDSVEHRQNTIANFNDIEGDAAGNVPNVTAAQVELGATLGTEAYTTDTSIVCQPVAPLGAGEERCSVWV